jgi:hypothetical protein
MKFRQTKLPGSFQIDLEPIADSKTFLRGPRAGKSSNARTVRFDNDGNQANAYQIEAVYLDLSNLGKRWRRLL